MMLPPSQEKGLQPWTSVWLCVSPVSLTPQAWFLCEHFPPNPFSRLPVGYWTEICAPVLWQSVFQIWQSEFLTHWIYTPKGVCLCKSIVTFHGCGTLMTLTQATGPGDISLWLTSQLKTQGQIGKPPHSSRSPACKRNFETNFSFWGRGAGTRACVCVCVGSGVVPEFTPNPLLILLKIVL